MVAPGGRGGQVAGLAVSDTSGGWCAEFVADSPAAAVKPGQAVAMPDWGGFTEPTCQAGEDGQEPSTITAEVGK